MDRTNRLLPGGRALALGLAALLPLPALAHPHVQVVARAAFVLDAQGRITGIRHHWTFDEAYSAFATTGMKKEGGKTAPSELKDLAKLNVDSLNEFGYFTVLKQAGKKLDFAAPLEGYALEDTGKALVLNFVLPLKKPVAPTSTTELRVDDETFFVAFSMDETQPAVIEGKSACKIEVKRPGKDSQGLQKMGEEFFNGLSSGFSEQYATTIKLNCP